MPVAKKRDTGKRKIEPKKKKEAESEKEDATPEEYAAPEWVEEVPLPKKVSRRRDLNKEKFLEKLAEMPIVQVAASQVGIHRSTYYRWYADDEDFRERADKALASGVGFVNDMMESLVIKLAKEGKTTPIIFWLKNHHPQYMDIRRYEHFHRHEFTEPDLTDERKQQIADAVRAWSVRHENERDEDYEVPKEEQE
jgi:hypothetical protein